MVKVLKKSLTRFSPVLHFFSGDIEMQYWVEMGLLDE